MVLLSNTDLAGAIKVGSRIQEVIHYLKIAHIHSHVKDIVTVSLGIASVIPNLEVSPDTLISYADKALYMAKEQGRDRYAYHYEQNCDQ